MIPIVIGGFNFDDSPIVWELSADYEVASLQILLGRFYNLFDYTPGEEITLQPLAWTHNPAPVDGEPYYGNVDVIVSVYRKNFYVLIEKQFREIYGPHTATLLYKPYQTQPSDKDVVWVGIAQIEEMFYSDEKMQSALLAILQNKTFYQSPKTAAEIIIL